MKPKTPERQKERALGSAPSARCFRNTVKAGLVSGQRGETSSKESADSWHINTQKAELCSWLSVPHSMCERGSMTQPQRYVYIYRPLRVKRPLRAQRAPIKERFHFFIKPILRQGCWRVFYDDWLESCAGPDMVMYFEEKLNHLLIYWKLQCFKNGTPGRSHSNTSLNGLKNTNTERYS